MSTQPNDGGPAFPTKHPALDQRAAGFHTEAGMLLRDYFAAKALPQAMSYCIPIGGTEFDLRPKALAVTAKVSYSMADAMLAERAKRNAPVARDEGHGGM